MEKKNKEILIKGAKQLGLSLQSEQVEKFEIFLEELRDWNKRINLISNSSELIVVVKHFLDSLTIVKSGKIKGYEKVVDIGTGAGFPGLPLKILYPHLKLTLIESIKKRTNFLLQLKEVVKIQDVSILNIRVEDFARDLTVRESFDIALARAVARLPVLAEYSLPLLLKGGFLIAQKGKAIEQEAKEAREAIEVLGGKLEAILPVNLPYAEEKRYLGIIKKTESTPLKYPRRAGIPQKRPLI